MNQDPLTIITMGKPLTSNRVFDENLSKKRFRRVFTRSAQPTGRMEGDGGAAGEERWTLVRVGSVFVTELNKLYYLKPVQIQLVENKPAHLIGSTLGSLADTRLNSTFVSQSHCQIVCIKKTWFLQDTGSARGTFCNGERIDDVHELHENDIIGIGVPDFLGDTLEELRQCFLFSFIKESSMNMSSANGSEHVEDMEVEDASEGNPNFIYQAAKLAQNPTLAYKCKLCPTSFECIDNYKKHKKQHGLVPPQPFPCTICNYSCNAKMAITKHMQKHQRQDVLRKHASKIGVTRKGADKRVAFKKSTKRNTASNAEVRQKNFICSHCPAAFETSKDMNKHLQRHGKDAGPFKCHMCTFASKMNFHLARHMEVHKKISQTETEPKLQPPPTAEDEALIYPCTKCPASFVTPRDLRIHLQKHGLRTAYPCPKCDYGAGRTDYLAKHLLVHQLPNPEPDSAKTKRSPISARVKLFSCSQCPASFAQNRDLQRHTSLHGSGRPFQCRFCSFASKRSWSRRQHELVHSAPATKKIVTANKKRVQSASNYSIAKSSGILKKLLLAKSLDGGAGKYTRISKMVSEEEYHRLTTGNPDFQYKDILKTMPTGNVKALNCTYKCWKCPSAFQSLPGLATHSRLHESSFKHKCGVCSYSVDSTLLMERHKELHENQKDVKKKSPQKRSVATKSTSMGPNKAGVRRRLSNSSHQTLSPENPSHVKKLKFDSPLKPPTSVTSAPEMYPIEEITNNEQANLSGQLITSLKVTNFMCFPEMELQITTHPQAFYGETEKGKSASILALLLGIGYDVGLPNYTPESLCGWELKKEVVRRGSETALIELVISLHSSMELEEQYGSHLKLQRLIYKGIPLASSKFEISSMDVLKRHASSPKVLGLSGLRSVLTKLKILPVYFPLLHLDRQSMQQLLDNPGSWYDFFEQNIKSQRDQIEEKLKDLDLVFTRMNNDIRWRTKKLEFHLNQLKAEYPVDDVKFQEWRKLDIARHSETKKELEAIKQKQLVLEKLITSYKDELTQIPVLILRQLQNIYCKFLYASKLGGGILIDHDSKKIGLWVREMTFCGDEKPPSTVEEAETAWEDLSRQKKHMAIIGLFIAFWKCIEDCPFFCVDAHSASELEFRFPKNGLPVLLEIIASKRIKGQQFFISLPTEP